MHTQYTVHSTHTYIHPYVLTHTRTDRHIHTYTHTGSHVHTYIRVRTCESLESKTCTEKHVKKGFTHDELLLELLDDELDDDELIMKQTSEQHQCYVRTYIQKLDISTSL